MSAGRARGTQAGSAPRGSARSGGDPRKLWVRIGLRALIGLLAGAAAIGFSELVAGFVRPESAPLAAVGAGAIKLTPEWAKEFAIQHFGSHDKLALEIGIGVILALIAPVIGLLTAVHRVLGIIGIALFGVVGVVAAMGLADAGSLDLLPSALAAVVGVIVIALLTSWSALPSHWGAGSRRRAVEVDSAPHDASSADEARPAHRAGSPAAGADPSTDRSTPSDATSTDATAEPVSTEPASTEPVSTGTAAAGATPIGVQASDGTAAAERPGKRDAASGGTEGSRRVERPPVMWSPGADEEPDVPFAGASRRRVLGVATAAVAGFSVLSYVGGRGIQGARFQAGKSRALVKLPQPAHPAPALPQGVDLKVPGAPPWRTSNADFYRVDTALTVPQLDAQSWQLKIHGRVDHTRTISFADLLKRPLIERDITLTCVSDPVGGPYIGNARWLGVPLRDLLREVGVHSDADQLVSRSSDGMTIGTPTSVVMDGRDAMLAVGMNGEPLPIKHGFPVRMVVPGLYGYVSACKWLVDIELTSFADYDAYWVPRGYSAKAPIKTESRIDAPKPFGQVKAGAVMVGGVAWAQHRGIKRVEVQVDDGDWQEARLAAAPSSDTWRQWVYTWQAGKGQHNLRVRATDSTGVTQTEKRAEVAPNGATGWHQISVTVT